MCLSIVETKNGRLLNAPDSTWGRSCFEVLLSCYRALGCQYTSKWSKDKHIDYQVGYVFVWAILVQAWSMVCCIIHDRLALSFAHVFPLADNEQIVLAQTKIEWLKPLFVGLHPWCWDKNRHIWMLTCTVWRVKSCIYIGFLRHFVGISIHPFEFSILIIFDTSFFVGDL